jgi:hypothetical protein
MYLISYFREYEMKIIMDLVQPAGARIKPPDSMLQEFGKASVNMPVQLIASLLISNLQEDNIWAVKAVSFKKFIYLKLNLNFNYFLFALIDRKLIMLSNTYARPSHNIKGTSNIILIK